MPTYEITGPDGRKFKITGPNKEGALAALQAQMAQSAPQEGDTSMSTAFKVGDARTIAATKGYMADASRQMEQGPVGRLMQAGEDYLAKPISDALGIERGSRADAVAEEQARVDSEAQMAAQRRDSVINDTNYQSMTTGDVKGVGSLLKFGGQKIAESASGMAATIASGGTMALPMAAGEINENLRDIEGLSEEDRIRLATGGGAISAVLENLGIGLLFKGIPNDVLGKMGVEGVSKVLEKNGLGRFSKRVASGVATEGVTEAAQEGVSIGAEAIGGRDFTSADVKSRLIEAAAAGGASGGGLRGGASIAGGVVDTVKSKPREDTPEARAEATFAQRIQRTAERGDLNGTPFNLKDVNTASQNGVRALIDATHTNLVGEMASEAKVLKDLLNPNDTDVFDDAFRKVQAQVGLKMARNKTKSVVTKDNFDALEAIVGDTSEGQNLLNLVRESQVLTKIHNDGYKGGVSQYTDAALPFDGAQNTYNSAAQIARTTLGPMGAVYAGVATGGASIPIQAGVALGGRGVDKVTGRRSRLNRFVKQNANNPGIETPTGLPSIKQDRIDQAAAAQRAEEAKASDAAAHTEALKQTNLGLAKKGAGPTEGSPQDIVEAATGLDRSGVAEILRAIERTNQDPIIQDAIQGYRSSVAVGGRVPDISPLIRTIKQMVESQPYFKELRVREPDTGATQAAPTSSIQTSPENYQRGIDDNKAMLQDLKDEAKTDATLSPADKAKVLEALDQLGMNLGSDPGAKVNEIMGKLQSVDPDAVAQFVEPYVTRVMGQQNAAPRNSAPGPAPEGEPRPSKPALQSFTNPLQIPDNEIDATRLNSSPSEANIQKMREGTYKPKTKRTLVEAADYMHQKWKAATGRDEAFDYTPENVDIISSYMATEAANALQSDANAIGWYDRKLKAAKRVVSLVDPRVTQSADAEAAFDFALAVTSNGQAVAENFKYALEVFRFFMDNGQMPINTWKKGGERNAAMVEAFDFFNAYQSSGANMPIQDFLDRDFTVNELNDYIARFNEQYGTNIKVPSSEGANAAVKGSYIIGPKIGQGFYQNIRGNYDPLTMDIWWMRMWNRLVGRPFEANKDLDKNRARVRKALQTKNQDALEKRLTKETLKDMDLTRADLNNNDTLDEFVLNLESRYQSFYRQESKRLKGTGQKVPKPELANATGTMKRNLSPQLQATPKGPGERSYMRDVTKAAIAKLRDLGYNIETADFQALMWYPEKQLFRHLGVAPGRGSDNDYLDAAIMLAEAEGITNDQIQEALPNADGDGAVNNQPGSKGVDEGLYRGTSGTSPGQEGQARQSIPGGILSAGANPSNNPVRSRAPEVPEVKQQTALVNASIEIGKPGSEFENGIKDMAGVEKLAAAYGVVLKFYNSNTEMLQAVPSADKSAMGAYTPRSKTAHIVSTGNIQELITALHETLHAVGMGSLKTGNFLGEADTVNGLTGQPDKAGIGSLETYMDFIFGKGKSNHLRREVLSELKHIQDSAQFSTMGVQGPIRGAQSMAMMLKKAKRDLEADGQSFEAQKAKVRKELKDFQNYERSIGELTVDALILYAHDPKGMKRVAPQTAKVMRELLRAAGNKKIQFYSHPLAMAVAVAMAIMAKAGMEEEEEKQQMPPGMLSPQLGMLSA